MHYLLIGLVALAGSALTFFSGFGLGTVLMPAFAIFFPVPVAVALTAVVHFLNNLFKVSLVGKHVDAEAFRRFSLPSLPAALVGSYLLVSLGEIAPIATYSLAGRTFEIMPVKLAIAALMIGFALLETVPKLRDWSVDPKYLPLGGVLSGFFGGLSGHQGALRSAFLIRAGLNKESFIATGVLTACFVDAVRLFVYGARLSSAQWTENSSLLLTATLSAFAGAYLGNQLLDKITLRAVQAIVAVMLVGIALLLGAGVI